MYHERQAGVTGVGTCAVCACNNLLQNRFFDKASFEAISQGLPESGHSLSLIGKRYSIGFYDANVIVAALEMAGMHCSWHDSRTHYISPDDICHDTPFKEASAADFVGVVINVGSPSVQFQGVSFGDSGNAIRQAMGMAKHWICSRPLDGTWFAFDSTHASPDLIGTVEDAAAFLTACLASEATIIKVFRLHQP
ncbi:hypothetical protein Pelo_7551 [Pelomyxa schiedti]|nr:hypothetical protein Pelo_7551 [Pelomyxa schiedti]